MRSRVVGRANDPASAWAPIFRAANQAGTKYHFIEDEAPQAEKQIPMTLQYLAGLRL